MIKRLRQRERPSRARRNDSRLEEARLEENRLDETLLDERSLDGLGDLPEAYVDSSSQFYLKVDSCLEELASVQAWFQALIDESAIRAFQPSAWIGEPFDQINLALAEGFTNAVRHAHEDKPETTPVLIECWVDPQRIEIRIFDQGEPFDPDSLVEPKPGTLREGGYGWFLLRRLVDQVTYERVQPEILAKRVFRAKTAHPVCTYAVPNNSDIGRVRNCLKLVKLA